LPTPEKTIRRAGIPAASARRSSPPDTTSAPAPMAPRVRITARFPLALTAKQIRASSPLTASWKTRKWRSSVAEE